MSFLKGFNGEIANNTCMVLNNNKTCRIINDVCKVDNIFSLKFSQN